MFFLANNNLLKIFTFTSHCLKSIKVKWSNWSIFLEKSEFLLNEMTAFSTGWHYMSACNSFIETKLMLEVYQEKVMILGQQDRMI